jgi:hypothetical protein
MPAGKMMVRQEYTADAKLVAYCVGVPKEKNVRIEVDDDAISRIFLLHIAAEARLESENELRSGPSRPDGLQRRIGGE